MEEQSKLTSEKLALAILQKPHPLIQPIKHPIRLEPPIRPRDPLKRRQLLPQPLRQRAPRPQPVDDLLLVPDDAVAVAVLGLQDLPALGHADQRGLPRLVRGDGAGLGEREQLRALGARQHVVEHDGVAALVLGELRLGPVDAGERHGRGARRRGGEEVCGDRHGVGGVGGPDGLGAAFRGRGPLLAAAWEEGAERHCGGLCAQTAQGLLSGVFVSGEWDRCQCRQYRDWCWVERAAIWAPRRWVFTRGEESHCLELASGRSGSLAVAVSDWPQAERVERHARLSLCGNDAKLEENL